MERKYEQVVRFIRETPWAIKPQMLLTIRSVVAAHLAGVELEPIEAAKPKSLNSANPANSVGVLPLWGVIVPHAGLMTNMSGGTSLSEWVNELRAMVADPSISTIILDVNSPGGSVEMVPEAAAEVRAATAKKRVVAVANPEIASAAYWIAAQAEELVMPMSGMVGSVGVIAEHIDDSEAVKMAGLTRTAITAGDFKAEQLGPLSDEAKAAIQKNVDRFYGMFIQDLAKGRGITPTQVKNSFGQGRMLNAEDALASGMVDRIGTLDTVIAKELPAQRATSRNRGAFDLSSGGGGGSVEQNTGTTTVTTVGSHSNPLWTGQIAATSGSGSLHNAPIGATGPPMGPNDPIVFEFKPVPELPPGDPPAQESSEQSGPVKRAATKPTTPLKEGQMDGERSMTLEELAARRDEIKARMQEIHTEAQGRQFYEEEQNEFDTLDQEWQDVEAAIVNVQDRETRLALAARTGNGTVSGDGAKPITRSSVARGGIYTNIVNLPDNIYDLTSYRGFGSTPEEMFRMYREGALRAIDSLPFEANDDVAKTESSRLLRRDKDAMFARRVLTTGSSLYDRAFGKMVMGYPLSSQEDAAMKAAVSETGLGSELPVPVTIDPTVLLTSDGAVNPLRQIARNITITGNKWQGISSDGMDVAYEAELTQVADQTPNFDAPAATVAKAHAYVEFSIEVDQDWGELRSNLQVFFQDAKDMKEANKFLFGSGTDEPMGLLTALEAAGGSTIVNTGTINTFEVGDVYKVKSALPPRFRSGASWLANDTVYSFVRQFDTAGGSSLWAQLGADRPAVLLGKPVYEASEMSDETTVGGEDIMIYGDFARGFIIVDRIGLNVELIPHVIGANRRPIGARAMYAYFRNTSQLLTANAFRVLNVKAT